MSRHHWMYFGCQCSSARCSRLLLERLTLFGIFSAEIMAASLSKTMPRRQGHKGKKGHRGNTVNALVSPVQASFCSGLGVLCNLGVLGVVLRALPVELRPALLSVDFQRALLADGVRPLEDPVLPGREPSEDLRLHRLGPGEPQVRLEPGHRVGREGGALFDRQPHLVL